MNMNKKWTSLALAGALTLGLLAGCGGSNPGGGGNGEKVIKLGVFEPASGDSASGGKKESLGVQYANYVTPTVEINGEEYKVELVPADNGSSTDKAPSAASQLVNEGVSLVLGSYGSGVSMAGGPIFDEAGLAAIGITCTNPNVTAGNDYYFRICFLDNFQAQILSNFAQEKFQAQTAYLLGELGNEYDQGLIAFFEQVFTAAGGKVVKDSFPSNSSDFTTYLNRAKDEQADIIFTPVSIAYATQILTQAASLDIDIPFLGSDTPSTPPPALWRPTAETTPSPRCPPWAMTHTMWLWRPSRPPTPWTPPPSRPRCGMWSMTVFPATSPLTTKTATPSVTPPTSSTPPTAAPGSWKPFRPPNN